MNKRNNSKMVAVVRLIAGVVTIVNLFLIEKGVTPIPFDEAQITEFGSLGLAIAADIWGWWKNNNITEKAQLAQDYKNLLDVKTEDDNEFYEDGEGAEDDD